MATLYFFGNCVINNIQWNFDKAVPSIFSNIVGHFSPLMDKSQVLEFTSKIIEEDVIMQPPPKNYRTITILNALSPNLRKQNYIDTTTTFMFIQSF